MDSTWSDLRRLPDRSMLIYRNNNRQEADYSTSDNEFDEPEIISDSTGPLRRQAQAQAMEDHDDKHKDMPISVSFSRISHGNVGQVNVNRVSTSSSTMHYGESSCAGLVHGLALFGLVGVSCMIWLAVLTMGAR
ncbi:hypothetical protein F4824DRAFT_496196 [Ustulina deusta]|nr:hypothetical protein F4824DRAFT_496196 [Ustulina deusta]